MLGAETELGHSHCDKDRAAPYDGGPRAVGTASEGWQKLLDVGGQSFAPEPARRACCKRLYFLPDYRDAARVLERGPGVPQLQSPGSLVLAIAHILVASSLMDCCCAWRPARWRRTGPPNGTV